MSAASPTPIGRTEAAVVALLTLAGGALRFGGLGTKSLWYDEAVIYHVVQGGWREILTQNALENSAPPLYALLLGLLTGPDAPEAVLRALSAVAGTAAIPLCFILGRQFLPARSGWLVAFLVAVSPAQVLYSQQLREYSLTTCAAALILLAGIKFIRTPDDRRATWLAAAAVFGLLVQHGLGLLLAALNVVCLAAFALRREPTASYRRWFLAQLPAGALAVVLYVTVVRHQNALVTEAALGYLKPHFWDGTGAGLVELLFAPDHSIVAFGLPGPAMLVAWVIGLAAFAFGARSALATALCLTSIALTVAAAMAGLYPYGPIRQCIFLTPMIFVCATLGADRLLALLPARLPAAVTQMPAFALALLLGLPGLGAALSIVSQDPGYQPMRMVVEALALQHRPEERIYVYYNAIPAFRYYWRNRSDPWIAGALHRSFMDDGKYEERMEEVQQELRDLSAPGDPFWVVVSHISDEDQNWLLEIVERYGRVEVVEQGPGSALLRVTPIGGRLF
jgi:hypothetical protein